MNCSNPNEDKPNQLPSVRISENSGHPKLDLVTLDGVVLVAVGEVVLVLLLLVVVVAVAVEFCWPSEEVWAVFESLVGKRADVVVVAAVVVVAEVVAAAVVAVAAELAVAVVDGTVVSLTLLQTCFESERNFGNGNIRLVSKTGFQHSCKLCVTQ